MTIDKVWDEVMTYFGGGFPYVRMCATLTVRFSLGESFEELVEDYDLKSIDECINIIRDEIWIKNQPKSKRVFQKLLKEYDSEASIEERERKLWLIIRFAEHKNLDIPEWVLEELAVVVTKVVRKELYELDKP